MLKILVTGATGNVGGEVVRQLRAEGLGGLVRAGVRSPGRGSLGAEGAGIEEVELDFERPETFGPALTQIQKLFLVRPPALSSAKRHMAPIIRAARAAGVEHIVFLSLLGVEKNPLVPHHQIEAYIRASGVAFTFLRASYFMQNLSSIHRADIRDRSEILLPAGSGKTSFIDVRDVAAAGVKALREPGHEGRAYALTGGEALDYHEVARLLSEVLGRPIAYRSPSLPRFILAARAQGIPLGFALVMAGIYTAARVGLAGAVTRDTEALLGRAPISMRKFIEDFKSHWA